MDKDAKLDFDQDLYSRQLSTFGPEMMQKLIKLRVFISGLRGMGVETAKNLILAGPKKVVVHDDSIVEARDLGSNFYCKQEDVGKQTRAEASLQQLISLNDNVNVGIHKGAVDEKVLNDFDVIVFTEQYDKEYLTRINNWARSQTPAKGFVWSGLLGLYGFTFVDFGKGFECLDNDGEDPKNGNITQIVPGEKTKVVTHALHNLSDGDYVRFKEIEGCTELNGKLCKVKTLSGQAFEVEVDSTNFGKFTQNGQFDQVKVPIKINFKSLADSLVSPSDDSFPPMMDPDLVKWGRATQLHVGINAVLNFYASNKQLPRFNNTEDATALVKAYTDFNETDKENKDRIRAESVEEEIVTKISKFARAQTSSHSAFWGGVIAQEILKHTGKYMPLRQWLHFDQFELAPTEQVNTDLKGSRYDDQIAIFGNEFQEKLSNQKLFLVGAGALGCEYLKQMALSGFGTGPKGEIICTDDDTIEVSNLNRQFLFRRPDVKKSKSECACREAKKMNPNFKVTALKTRVSPENYDTFTDEFWESLDGVVNAVDNIKARLYIDNRCVFYGKHLFESGTLGTKCNSQCIVPKQTQSYGESKDPEEKSIPMCTLRNFPYLIDHCIEWARDYFEGEFGSGSREFQKYAENPNKYLTDTKNELKEQQHMLRGKLEIINTIGQNLKEATHTTCIRLARTKFQELFHNSIAQLCYNLPEDAKDSDGKPFWAGLKRFPSAIKFDANDPEHVNFLVSTAELYAFMFKLPPINNQNLILKEAGEIKVEEFVPKKMSIQTNEQESGDDKAEDDEQRIEELCKTLSAGGSSATVNPIIFEKDDDSNHHIDFITAVSNLRARNYKIDEVPRFKVKTIAGKITPAIATSTAMIVGLVGQEVFKFIQGRKIDVYRNSFCNLALPLFLLSETLPPIEKKDKDYDVILMGPVKAIPPKWTTWDSIDVQGPKTLKQIQAEVKEKYNVNISIWELNGVYLLGASGIPKTERLDLTPEDAFKAESGEEYPAGRLYLEMNCDADMDDGTDCVIPRLKYRRK